MTRLTKKQRQYIESARGALGYGQYAEADRWLKRLLADDVMSRPTKTNRCVVCSGALSGTIVARTEPDLEKAKSDARYAHRRCAENIGLPTFPLNLR